MQTYSTFTKAELRSNQDLRDKINGYIDNCAFNFVCHICKDNEWNSHNRPGLFLSTQTLQIEKTYVVIPKHHIQCREMFKLNPLAYL